MSVYFPDVSCQTAFNLNKDLIETWHPDPTGTGAYKIWDAIEEEQIWSTRVSKDGYIDDIMFQYFPDTGDFRDVGC